MQEDSTARLQIEPIGCVRTTKRFKFDAPSQPDSTSAETNQIVLLPGREFERALSDLEGFDRIWIISWFDRNKTWRPRVLPPRGPAKRRGVFSTRSPHRPNPIGLTCVSLIDVVGLVLTIGPVDLTDGTPVLDIKPYLRTVDCHPDSRLGWLTEVEEASLRPPQYQIEIGPIASAQLEWLREEWHIDFTERAFGILQQDPFPHRTRRILKLDGGEFRMACGAWRIFFSIEGKTVRILRIGKGYSDETLHANFASDIIDRDAQVAFQNKFGARARLDA